MTAIFAYSGCWQGVRSDVVRWEPEQLALVRLGVANVRWACAALRLATHRKQMPIAANVGGACVRLKCEHELDLKY